MKYINALDLINLCIENDLLKVVDGYIPVYKEGENIKSGWYGYNKEDLAQELMYDEKGYNYLIAKLKELGIEFKQRF